MEEARLLTLPGIGGSGDRHWQTLWEREDPSIRRFAPSRWDRPALADWVAALEHAVAESPGPPLLVAHSLACLLVAHWAARTARSVAGAFLVAVPDPQGPVFPAEAAEFRSVPVRPLTFAALIVASTDDPFGGVDHARLRADQWRAGLAVVGAFGHLNEASELADWPQGRALLAAFRAGLRC